MSPPCVRPSLSPSRIRLSLCLSLLLSLPRALRPEVLAVPTLTSSRAASCPQDPQRRAALHPRDLPGSLHSLLSLLLADRHAPPSKWIQPGPARHHECGPSLRVRRLQVPAHRPHSHAWPQRAVPGTQERPSVPVGRVFRGLWNCTLRVISCGVWVEVQAPFSCEPRPPPGSGTPQEAPCHTHPSHTGPQADTCRPLLGSSARPLLQAARTDHDPQGHLFSPMWSCLDCHPGTGPAPGPCHRAAARPCPWAPHFHLSLQKLVRADPTSHLI